MIQRFKNVYHYLLSWLGNIIYLFPSRKIFVLGVTGTKGKSTTVELINAILESAGKKTAMISSLRFKIGDKSIKNVSSNTMPGRFFIQRKLRKAVNVGCEYFLMEVTSQGIVQHRHRFIDFDAALYTNVKPEHIEAHGSFENYRDAKVSFFDYASRYSKKSPKYFFINEEDVSKNYFVNAVGGSDKVIYFSRHKVLDDLSRKTIADWFVNSFNLENAAAAVAFARSQNISDVVIEKVLRNFRGIPGRLEMVREKPFRVLIDYAHTPDSLEKVYQTLSGSGKSPNQKLLCVLGAAGGGRDKWKRPVMGKIAAEYCKQIILTNEDPYDEQPEKIIEEIFSGCSKILNPKSEILKILDRKEAIKKAILLAKNGDTVIVTGKGSESWIHIADGKKIPWDERKAVEDLLK